MIGVGSAQQLPPASLSCFVECLGSELTCSLSHTLSLAKSVTLTCEKLSADLRSDRPCCLTSLRLTIRARSQESSIGMILSLLHTRSLPILTFTLSLFKPFIRIFSLLFVDVAKRSEGWMRRPEQSSRSEISCRTGSDAGMPFDAHGPSFLPPHFEECVTLIWKTFDYLSLE